MNIRTRSFFEKPVALRRSRLARPPCYRLPSVRRRARRRSTACYRRRCRSVAFGSDAQQRSRAKSSALPAAACRLVTMSLNLLELFLFAPFSSGGSSCSDRRDRVALHVSLQGVGQRRLNPFDDIPSNGQPNGKSDHQADHRLEQAGAQLFQVLPECHRGVLKQIGFVVASSHAGKAKNGCEQAHGARRVLGESYPGDITNL